MNRRSLLAALSSSLLFACGAGSVSTQPGVDAEVDKGLVVTSDSLLGGEVCANHYDDDGDGEVDEDCPCDPAETPEQWCYPGPFGTMDVGPCQAGTQYCIERGEFSYFGECKGGVGPSPEICDDHLDNDCNGTIDDCAEPKTDGSTDDGGVGDGDGGTTTLDDGGGAPNADASVDSGSGLPPDLCGPHSCAGCCDHFGVCHQVPSQQFCALGGVLCKPCNAMEQCNAQTGTCEWLTLGSDLIAVSAASAIVTDDDDCGWFDTCDPYVKVRVGGHYGESGTDVDDETPVWNDLIFNIPRNDLLSQKMEITFMDEDSFLRFDDDTIARCDVQVTEADITAGTLQMNCTGDVSNLIFLFRDI